MSAQEDCRLFADRIPDYLSGAAIEDRPRFLSHMACCAACRQELLDTARLKRHVSRYFDSDPVPDVKEGLLALKRTLGMGGTNGGGIAEGSPSVPAATDTEWAVAVSAAKALSNMVAGVVAFTTPGFWAMVGRRIAEVF